MGLIQYIKKKIEKSKAKRVFKKYGYAVKEFDVAGFGIVKFAQWQNPLEQEKQVTASHILRERGAPCTRLISTILFITNFSSNASKVS